MHGRATALASGTIVNAIATGKGAAFGIDLKINVEVRLNSDPGNINVKILDDEFEKSDLIENCVNLVLKRFDLSDIHGADIMTSSEIPIARGLSSSSAASNATVLATIAALNERLNDEEVINLGVDASVASNVTITGAFDDAAASYFGGAVVTDNSSRKVLKKHPMEDLYVLIYVPDLKSYTSKVDVERTRTLSSLVDIAHSIALEGYPYQALTLNGLLYSASLGYDPKIALDALEKGALAAGLSGKGPAVIALVEEDKLDEVKLAWLEGHGKVLQTRTNNDGSSILS